MWFEVDCLWPHAQLVLEFDGGRFHRHPKAFERDRRRDQILAAAGYRVIRVTWRQLRDEPMAVMVRVGQALVVPVAAA
jgi:very-short-patch-repair endonuclease